MANPENESVEGADKLTGSQGTNASQAGEPTGNPELHLVDLGQVSQDTAVTISTGKFEILVRLRKPKQ
jgi:hypothetical protein